MADDEDYEGEMDGEGDEYGDEPPVEDLDLDNGEEEVERAHITEVLKAK